MRFARMMSWASLSGACILTLACASGRAPSGQQTEARLQPPRMLSRGAPPALQIPGQTPSGRPQVRLTIEVEVDESGRADLRTLDIRGPGAGQNRAAIEQWLGQAMFRPAQRNGLSVRGVYRTSIEARVTVRRIG